MIANVAKKPYGFQVIVGETMKGAYTKTFCNSTHNGRENAKRRAEEHLKWYCETHDVDPPVKGLIKRSYKEPPRNNNTSGFSGVYRISPEDKRRPKGQKLHYWCAHYYILKSNGRKKASHKNYSIQKLGEEEARRLAIEFRIGWEEAVRKGKDALGLFFEEDKIKTEKLKLAHKIHILIEAKEAIYNISLKETKGGMGYMARIRIPRGKSDVLTKFFNLKKHSTRSAAMKAAKRWIRDIYEEYDLEDMTGKRYS